MVLFDGSNHAELGSQFREAFLLSSLGKAFVHVSPFVVFAGSSSGQVCSRVTDAVQFLEPHFGVFFFVFSGLQEKCSNLFVAFLLCNGCEIGVFVSGAGFSVKCGVEVFLRLGACVFVCRSFFDQFQLVAGGFAKRANRGFAVLHFKHFSAYFTFVLFHCFFLLDIFFLFKIRQPDFSGCGRGDIVLFAWLTCVADAGVSGDIAA